MKRLLALLVLVVGCSGRADYPIPQPDAGALCDDACCIECAQLRRVGCREGRPLACEETCRNMVELKIPPPLDCVARAGADVDAIRACGLRCLP